jgi:hypothetical protein
MRRRVYKLFSRQSAIKFTSYHSKRTSKDWNRSTTATTLLDRLELMKHSSKWWDRSGLFLALITLPKVLSSELQSNLCKVLWRLEKFFSLRFMTIRTIFSLSFITTRSIFSLSFTMTRSIFSLSFITYITRWWSTNSVVVFINDQNITRW